MEQTLNPRLSIIHSTQGSRYQNPIELSKITRILSSLGVKAGEGKRRRMRRRVVRDDAVGTQLEGRGVVQHVSEGTLQQLQIATRALVDRGTQMLLQILALENCQTQFPAFAGDGGGASRRHP
jgi:hypothetical protein